jgi:hypothetical protein
MIGFDPYGVEQTWGSAGILIMYAGVALILAELLGILEEIV